MNALRALTLSIALLAAPAAQAQVVDLSKTPCKDFLASGQNGIMIIWAWLYGYYADQDADPVVDFAKLTEKGQKLAEACKASPGQGHHLGRRDDLRITVVLPAPTRQRAGAGARDEVNSPPAAAASRRFPARA